MILFILFRKWFNLNAEAPEDALNKHFQAVYLLHQLSLIAWRSTPKKIARIAEKVAVATLK